MSILNDGVNALTTSSAPASAPEPETEPDSFDPADHTIPEIKEHIEAHPDQRGSVLESERSGKNRSTLVEWLDEPAGDGAGDTTSEEN